MLLSLSLGLLGSIGHCIGMCSAVMLLFSRHQAFQAPSAWVACHIGRLTTYTLLGLAAGSIGDLLGQTIPQAAWVSGTIALVFALGALYLAVAMLGAAPSPELVFSSLVKKWGELFRTAQRQPRIPAFGLGLLWGLLPCGLVISALLLSAASGSALRGALGMLLFGVGTLPALVGVSWASKHIRPAGWVRYPAALVMILFSVQFTMRGLASWGLVDHFMTGAVMLW